MTASDETLPGWTRLYSGKVRELYTSASHPGRVLMVASDRVSAFDHLLEPGIPGKGALLTSLSLWWFAQLQGIPNHLAGPDAAIPDAVAGRAMLVKALDMYPIECVVRGYVAGSAWVEYQKAGSICGVALPDGLQFGDSAKANTADYYAEGHKVLEQTGRDRVEPGVETPLPVRFVS